MRRGPPPGAPLPALPLPAHWRVMEQGSLDPEAGTLLPQTRAEPRDGRGRDWGLHILSGVVGPQENPIRGSTAQGTVTAIRGRGEKAGGL